MTINCGNVYIFYTTSENRDQRNVLKLNKILFD